MTTKLEELAAALAAAPDDEAVRAVFADAALEERDETWRAIGERMILAQAPERGEEARALERALRASGKLGGRKVVRMVLDRGLVRRADFGAAPFKLPEIAGVLARPELRTVSEVDLRRAWPQAKRSQRELLGALRAVLPPRTRWLGLGRGADVGAVLEAFPSLTGLALEAEGTPPFEQLARITDLELACADFDARALERLLRSGLDLRRLVIHATEAAPRPRALEPILERHAFPNLTSFGVMFPAERRTLAFLEALAPSPLFAQLRSFGVALDGAERAERWLTEHDSAWAGKSLFTGPGAVLEAPIWEETWDSLGAVLAEVGRDEEALAIREDLVLLDPRSSWYWENLGDSRHAVGDLGAALEAYEKAAKTDRGNAAAWRGVGDVLEELERPAEALQAWQRSVKLEPRTPHGHLGVGSALAALRRYDEALAAFSEAWRLDRTFFWAPSYRADVYLRLGRLDEALADYERCLAPGANKVDLAADVDTVRDVLVGIARVWRLRGDFERARASLRRARALDIEPNERAQIDVELLVLALAAGELDDALALAEARCASEDADDEDRELHAWVLVERGRGDEAAAAFASRTAPLLEVERALLLQAQGKDAEALASLTDATPDHECARWRLYADLARVVLLARAGRDAEAAAERGRIRALPHDPFALRDELTRAHVGERCLGETCVDGAAAAAVIACVLDRAPDEARARVDRLTDSLAMTSPRDRDAEPALRRIVRLAALETDPLVSRLLDVLEARALPGSLAPAAPR